MNSVYAISIPTIILNFVLYIDLDVDMNIFLASRYSALQVVQHATYVVIDLQLMGLCATRIVRIHDRIEVDVQNLRGSRSGWTYKRGQGLNLKGFQPIRPLSYNSEV